MFLGPGCDGFNGEIWSWKMGMAEILQPNTQEFGKISKNCHATVWAHHIYKNHIYVYITFIYLKNSKNTCTHFYSIYNTLMTAGMTSQLTSLSTGFLPWAGWSPPQVRLHQETHAQSVPRELQPPDATSRCIVASPNPQGFSISWLCLVLWTSCKSLKAFIKPSNQCCQK